MTDTHFLQLVDQAKKISPPPVFFRSRYRVDGGESVRVEQPLWDGIFKLGGVYSYRINPGVSSYLALLTRESIRDTIDFYLKLQLDRYDLVTVWGFWYLLATDVYLSDYYEVMRYVMNEQNDIYDRVYLIHVLATMTTIPLDKATPAITHFIEKSYIKDCTVDVVRQFLEKNSSIRTRLYLYDYSYEFLQLFDPKDPATSHIYKMPPLEIIINTEERSGFTPELFNTFLTTINQQVDERFVALASILRYYHISHGVNTLRTVFDIFGYPPAISQYTDPSKLLNDLSKYCEYVNDCIETNQKYWFWGNYYGPDYRLCDNIDREDAITMNVLHEQNLRDPRNPVIAFGNIFDFQCYLLSDIIDNFKAHDNIMLDGVLMSRRQLRTLHYMLNSMGEFDHMDSGEFDHVDQFKWQLIAPKDLSYSTMTRQERFYLLWLLVISWWLKYQDGPLGDMTSWPSNNTTGRDWQFTRSGQIYHSITDPAFNTIKNLHIKDRVNASYTVDQALTTCFKGEWCMNHMSDILKNTALAGLPYLAKDEASREDLERLFQEVLLWDLEQRGIAGFDKSKLPTLATKLGSTGDVEDHV